MARRDSGSVRRLPSGRWQARYLDRFGEQRSAPLTFTTRAEAAAFLARIQMRWGELGAAAARPRDQGNLFAAFEPEDRQGTRMAREPARVPR